MSHPTFADVVTGQRAVHVIARDAHHVAWLAERPVRPGDELSLVVTVLDSAPSSSGRYHVVSWRWEMFNQHGDRVLHLRAATLFPPA